MYALREAAKELNIDLKKATVAIQGYGNAGSFKSRFLIYGNDQDPAGNKVQRLETKDGRTTYWVPAIQK
jgi:glutamate dehydrogenase/leucine dehydrogenase